ncbi:MAG: hypothetical protein ACRELC_10775 [Gemmatimonadota bacterium]
MFYIYRERVKRSRLAEYEASTHDLLRLLRDAPFADEIRFTAVAGPELGYAYVTRIAGFAGLDGFQRYLLSCLEDSGELEAWRALEARSGETVEHAAAYVVQLRPDLSYLPERVRLDGELPYRLYRWYFVRPGHQEAVEELVQRAAELCGRRGISHGWRVYRVLLGEELPSYVVVERAASKADSARARARVSAAVGADIEALAREVRPHVRRVDVMDGLVRADLSFPPAARGYEL